MTLCNINFDQIISSFLIGNEIIISKLSLFLRNQGSPNVRLPVGIITIRRIEISKGRILTEFLN